ncbi:pseudouridine synthase [Acholeplasma granularum]|uniref:pseudouridine synthase n=1 Tax=Acholeplasma granularum TaxID=264635 RepID=UPI0004719D68|nr:pseudouridine synthase [Acholeplasma granularum]
MRLDKFLSNLKLGSRKDVKFMVKNGDVTLNGNPVYQYDMKIDPNYDKICVKGEHLYYKDDIILAFYKPVNYLSSNKDNIHPVLFDLIKSPYDRLDLKIAGRLDLDSEGLMILSNNGQIIHEITHPKKKVIKVYEATLDKILNLEDANKLLLGVELINTDGSTYFAQALNLTTMDSVATISIDEGKFHQVKKMFKKIGYEVINLKRIQIGALKLNLEPGKYQEISIDDIFGR